MAAPVHAAEAPQAFTFTYTPALLSTTEGRANTVQRLQREANSFCEESDSSINSRRAERVCEQDVLKKALLEINNRQPKAHARLVAEN